MNKKSLNKGSALVEIIVGASIMLIGVLAINLTYNTYMQYALANQKNVEASYLLQEGMEVMAFLRDKGWVNNFGNLSTSTTYYLSWDGSAWATTTSPEYVDGVFLRSITVADVKRDANDDIAPAGTYDPNIKLITSSVSYFQGHGTTTKTISRYLANIK